MRYNTSRALLVHYYVFSACGRAGCLLCRRNILLGDHGADEGLDRIALQDSE